MKQSFYFLFFLFLSAAMGATPSFGARARSAQCGMNNPQASVPQGMQEKRTRTPAQRKIDSQLLYALYRQQGLADAKGVPAGDLLVKFDEKGRAIITIRARVTKAVLAKVKSLGGEIISQSARYNDIRAHLPLSKLEELAALKDVRAIMPAEEATTNSAK
jgi:hypothetical protein